MSTAALLASPGRTTVRAGQQLIEMQPEV